MLAFLKALLTADDQRADAYAWLTNQAGHSALVGVPAALVLLWAGVVPAAVPALVAAIYGIGWEWAIQRSQRADGLTDTACVTAGAALICATFAYGLTLAAITFAIWAALLVFGVSRRLT